MKGRLKTIELIEKTAKERGISFDEAMGIIKREAEQKQRKREEREAAAEERRMAPIGGGLKLGEE
jgi:hypothetical protein